MKVTLMLLALLTGCATQPAVWVKPGGSEREFAMDLGQCQAQAFGIPGATLMQIAMVQSACLQGKGWQRSQ